MKELSKLNEVLWNIQDSNSYPDRNQYQEHILEQYKLYVEMADRVSSRRDTMNTFFLTLNSLILGAAGSILDKGIDFQSKWYFLFPYAVLILLCFFWWKLISSFKQLNTAKFMIIGAIESRLPVNLYGKAEWNYMLEEGKNKSVYWPLTHVEIWIPSVFAIGYTVGLISLVCS